MPKVLCDPKNSLLQEAQRLLTEGGYSAVTIRAVARGCGVGVGTVYNYFPSKEALLAEYLLEDWRKCMQRLQLVSKDARSPEPVARCIYEELGRYADQHSAIFRSQAAKGAFVSSIHQYHSLLRSQLAAPLERFCQDRFAAEFMAEALLTWTLAGKAFEAIWQLLEPLRTKPNPPTVGEGLDPP